MGQHIASSRASVNERRLKIMKTSQNLDSELPIFISGYSYPDDYRFDNRPAFATRDVLLLPWIYAKLGGGFSAMPAADEIQPASLSCSKKGFRTPPKRSA